MLGSHKILPPSHPTPPIAAADAPAPSADAGDTLSMDGAAPPPAGDMAGINLGEMSAPGSADPLGPLGDAPDAGSLSVGAEGQPVEAPPAPPMDMGVPLDMGGMGIPSVQDTALDMSAPLDMGDISEKVLPGMVPVESNPTGVPTAAPPAMSLEASTFASQALAEWRAEQQKALEEKRAAEERELKQIREEAQAERELMYTQREKQLQAAYKANRERQVVLEKATSEGWEGVLELIADDNAVKDKQGTDLSRFKQILTRLKHQKPLTSM